LRVHRVPVPPEAVQYLKQQGLVDPGASHSQIQSILERLIPASAAEAFYTLLRRHIAANPLPPPPATPAAVSAPSANRNTEAASKAHREREPERPSRPAAKAAKPNGAPARRKTAGRAYHHHGKRRGSARSARPSARR